MDFIFAILGSLLLSFIIALILTILGDNKNTNFLQKFIGIASFLIIKEAPERTILLPHSERNKNVQPSTGNGNILPFWQFFTTSKQRNVPETTRGTRCCKQDNSSRGRNGNDSGSTRRPQEERSDGRGNGRKIGPPVE